MSGVREDSGADNPRNESNSCGISTTSVRVKAPRRILHFSDGTLEEYSSDEESDKVDGAGSAADKQLAVVSS